MRAVIIEKSCTLKSVEKPIPVPGKNEVLIKVAYTAICGSDIGYWKGDLMLGYALGHEFSGTIADPGSSGFQAGENVCAMELNPCGKCPQCLSGHPNICTHTMDNAPGIARDGSYAEYVVVRSDMVRRLPDGVSLLESTLAEPFSVSWHGAKRAGIRPGEPVLINGGGPIGVFAAASAKLLGAGMVILTEADPSRVAIAKTLPYIDHVVNTGEPEYFSRIKSLCPQKFRVAIDCIGRTETVTTAIGLVQNGGSIVTMGLHDPVQSLPATKLLLKEISLIPSAFFVPDEYDEVLALMAKRKINVLPCITEIRPLDQAQASLEELDQPSGKPMKIVLQP